MMTVASIIGGAFALFAIAGAGYAVLAAWLAGRFVRAPLPAASLFPPITLLKPLHGLEPGLAAHLETFFRQDYPAPFQLVFGVQDSADAAMAIVETLRARYPSVDSALVVDGRRHGSNPKVSNLINMEPAARHDVIVLSDSDMVVAPDYLRKVAAALAPAEVGAVTCVYTGLPVAGFGSRLGAMGINYQFLPNVITGLALGLAKPCFGSTIALGRQVLKEIGGLGAFASHLADDNAIGLAVRQSGKKVAIPPFALRHACSETSFRSWWDHELRWMRTIRTVDPAGHAGSIVTHGFSLALLGAIFLGFDAFSLGVLLSTLVARGVLKWRFDKAFQEAGGPYWLLPLRDVLSFGVFVTSLFGASVVWQDAHLHVREDGGLVNR